MLVCSDVSEMLTEYTEGALGARKWAGVRWHLAFCPMCRAFLAQLRATRSVLARVRLPADAQGEARALALRERPGG